MEPLKREIFSYILLPRISETKKSTIKIKNKIRAIFVASPAIFPNPNMAAIIAITRKINVQRNIIVL